MIFYELMEANLPRIVQLELIFRIMIATVCGAVIGMERSRRFKDAGIRTHCMVACTAAVMMIISKYGFADLTNLAGDVFAGTHGADPARIAAQVVSGISFLCVGVIYRDRKDVTRGLTTAAGVWAVAGIGMAIGAGLYYIGLFTTAFVLALQLFMHKHTVGKDRFITARVGIVAMEDKAAFEQINRKFDEWHIAVLENGASRREDGLLDYDLVVRMRCTQSFQLITNHILENPKIRSIEVNEDS